MDSIQTSNPVAARALEFAQEARRKREEDQQAAAKTEHKPGEQHAIQVSFSQEAQIRLNEAKTQDAKRVDELRIAVRINAAEQRSQAIHQEIQKAAEVKREDRNIRRDRDSAASARAEATSKAAAQSEKQSDVAADVARKTTASGIARALAGQNKAAKDFEDKASAAIAIRTIDAHKREAGDILERASRDNAKNLDALKQLDKAEAERTKASKVNTERANAKATNALNMYHNVAKLK